MLVLSRRAGESLVIGDEIILTVLTIEGDRVKIGVTAPRDVPIKRQEMWQALKEQETIAEQLAANPNAPAFEELRQLLAADAPAE